MTIIRVDTRDLRKLVTSFDRLARRAGDTRPLMRNIASYLEFSIARRFETESGPDGVPWKPTIRGGQILTDTARLRSSITSRATATVAEAGTNVIYAAVHQLGAVIKPRRARKLRFFISGAPVFADQVTIPARPFLGIDGDDDRAIGDIVRDYFDKSLAPQ